MVTKEQFAAMQDHSILGAYCEEKDVVQYCKEALEYGFANVYVMPCFIKLARSIIPMGSKTGVGSTVAFPWGATTTEMKIAEGLDFIDKGATSLDMVINVSMLKNGHADYVRNELDGFVKAIRAKKAEVTIKIIVECHYLTREEKFLAANLVAESGADFVKQATGTTPNWSYTLGDLILLKSAVGDRCGVKASGGLINVEDALAAIEVCGATSIGNKRAVQWMKDFDDNRWYKK
ncbi:MAG: deoxyribose-phosphate aldolase [Planctomycetes bacterium]|nr:deoxyribose-phosphate aldolase [Planctomycetota bacterium]